MAELDFPAGTLITNFSFPSGAHSGVNTLFSGSSISDNDVSDNMFDTSETLTLSSPGSSSSFAALYQGTVNISGTDYPVFIYNGGYSVFGINLPAGTYPNFASLGTLDPSNLTVAFCFGAGTLIRTEAGETVVEDLKTGDLIFAETGDLVRVKWIGRQTVHKLFAGPRMQPVRIRAGALGDGLPHSDLTVTADHGMVLDGLVINASALVNGTTIDFVPMAELEDSFTVYHIETEHHDVILANGAPAETFVDAVTRSHFDNFQEYLDLYGAERIIPEMDRPRISSQRLVPEAIKARLGIAPIVDFELDAAQSA